MQQKSHIGAQGLRFFVVSLVAFGVNQLWLVVFIDWLDWRKVAVAGDRDRPRDAAEFPRQQALVLPAVTRLAVVAALVLSLAPAAHAATTTTHSVPTVTDPLTATSPATTTKPRSTKQQVIALFLANAKVADWLKRYPPKPITDATFAQGVWTVNVWSGNAGEIATGNGRRRHRRGRRGVDGAAGRVEDGARLHRAHSAATRSTATRCGSRSARSSCSGSSTGAGRSRSATLDLLVLLSFSVSLWFFNRGDVFTAMPLVYPPLVWLLARCLWVARRDRPTRGVPVWPVWVLAAATVFLAGFRIGLNVRASNVIDVGYSGVIGADRIVHGQSPYGHFPVEDNRSRSAALRTRPARCATTSRRTAAARSANPLGDTYGPVSYLAYIPGYAIFGWSGKWDTLPAVHFTSILFDTDRAARARARRAPVRRASTRGDARVRVGRVAVHAVRVELEHERLDRARAAHLGLPRADEPARARRGGRASPAGRSSPRCSLAAALVRLPGGAPRRGALYVARLRARDACSSSSCSSSSRRRWHAARVFYDRTVSFQIGRDSPFSLWDWGQYHAQGPARPAARAARPAGRCSSSARSRSRGSRATARRSGSPPSPRRVLVGFELVLTHWFYLYLPWFFPFVALALVGQLPGDAR